MVASKDVNYRKEPTLGGKIIKTFKRGEVLDFAGYVKGEPFKGNNMWLKGKHTGGYVWSGAMTSTSSSGLKDLNPKPAPKKVAPKPAPKKEEAILAQPEDAPVKDEPELVEVPPVETVTNVEEKEVTDTTKNPIKDKVKAGGAGTVGGGGIVTMLITVIQDRTGIEFSSTEAALIVTVVAAITGFVAAYYKRENK